MTVRSGLLRLSLIAALLVAVLAPASEASHQDNLEKAVQGLGGDALLNLTSLRIESSGTRATLDEGDDPDGPPGYPGPYTMTTSVDPSQAAFRLDTDMVSFVGIPRTLTEVVTEDGGYLDGQDNNFAPPFTAPMLSDRHVSTLLHQLLLHPQLLIAFAADNPDVASSQGRLLVIDIDGHPLYMAINRATGRPSRVWMLESDPLRRDTRMEVRYSDWTEVDGVQFPTEVVVRYAGKVVQEETRNSIEVNPALAPDLFDFPAGITPVFDPVLAERGIVNHQYLQSFAALGFPRDGFQPNVIGAELATGVYHLTGGTHHSLAVVQEGGVTVVEAPLDEVRSAAIVDWIDANIGLPVAHVVPSHFHADHSAGARYFFNNGADIVVHQNVKQFWAKVMRARSTVVPDRDEPPRGVLRRIATVPAGGSYVIDDPVNPVGVHTIESDHSSDLMIVEAGGVLFVVDIFSPGLPAGPDAAPIVPRVLELGLTIDTVAGGHGGTIPWSDFAALFP